MSILILIITRPLFRISRNGKVLVESIKTFARVSIFFDQIFILPVLKTLLNFYTYCTTQTQDSVYLFMKFKVYGVVLF